MTIEQQPQQRAMATLCPPEWRVADGACNLRVSCYRVFYVPKAMLIHLSQHPVEFMGARVLFLLGALSYISPGDLIYKPWTGEPPLQIEINAPPQTVTPVGAYLLFLKQCPIEPQPDDERALRDLEDGVIGLIRLYLGKTAAFDRVFHNTIRPDGKIEATSAWSEVPGGTGYQVLSLERVQALAQLANSIPENVRARIFLAVRWYNRAHSAQGADAFICAWIALETLAIPKGKDISDLARTLADIYNLPKHTAKQYLHIDRLYGIRKRIIHQGDLPGIRLEVIDYIRAILVDLMNDAVGAPACHEALAVLKRLPVEEAIHEALK